MGFLDYTWIREGYAFMSPANFAVDNNTAIYTQEIERMISLPVLTVQESFNLYEGGHHHEFTENATSSNEGVFNAIYNDAVRASLFYEYEDKYKIPKQEGSDYFVFANTTKQSAVDLCFLPGQSRFMIAKRYKGDSDLDLTPVWRSNMEVLNSWDPRPRSQEPYIVPKDSRVFIFHNKNTNAKYSGTVFKESFGFGMVDIINSIPTLKMFAIYGVEEVDIIHDRFDTFFGKLEYVPQTPYYIVSKKAVDYNPDDGSNIYNNGGMSQPTPANPRYDDDGNIIGWNPQLPGSTNPDFGELGRDDAGPEHAGSDILRSGMFRMYAMDVTQVYRFGSKLWSANILDTIVKYFDDPLKVVMGLMEFPFGVPHSPDVEITFSWIPAWANPLNITGGPLNKEYIEIDFGSIDVPRYSGTFYDYQPYTSAQLYIPYVGFVPLKFSEIVDAKLSLQYVISLTSGAGVANVISSKIGVIGTYNCTVGRMLPLSSRDLSSLYLAIAKAAVIGVATAGAGVAAGAASAGAVSASGAAEGAFSTALNLESVGLQESAGRMLNQAVYSEGVASNLSSQASKYSGIAKHGIKNFASSAINAVANANAPIQRSGSFDALSGRCAKQEAFLLISIPHQNVPSNYNGLIGYPSNVGGLLTDFSGYFEPRSIQIQAKGATSDEIAELEEIIYGGIYIG